MSNHEQFRYTYSALQQKEIAAIRSKYLPKEEAQEDKLMRLRRLHQMPTQKAQAASLAVGIIGALILGTGMSLIMTSLGAALGVVLATILGVLAGAVGLVMVALAYPIYNRVLKTQRERIAPEVLSLSDELLNQ